MFFLRSGMADFNEFLRNMFQHFAHLGGALEEGRSSARRPACRRGEAWSPGWRGMNRDTSLVWSPPHKGFVTFHPSPRILGATATLTPLTTTAKMRQRCEKLQDSQRAVPPAEAGTALESC